MIRPIFRRIRTALSGRDTDERSTTGDGTAGSLLDWSVNYSHGPDGGRGEAAREIAQIQETADLLDEQEQHRR
jgi:hypothetical protein